MKTHNSGNMGDGSDEETNEELKRIDADFQKTTEESGDAGAESDPYENQLRADVEP